MLEKNILSDEFITIKKKELEKIITRIVKSDDTTFLNFFSDYIKWNGIFGGAVAGLSAKWHNAEFLSKELSMKEIIQIRKYSHRIASNIFAAAEDEYSDENCKIEGLRLTHKDMAWAFFSSMMNYFEVDKRPDVPLRVESIIFKTLRGYGVLGEKYSLKDLIEYVGFHIGSEKIASLEFDILTEKIKEFRPELYSYLSNIEIIKSSGIKAIDWLKFHGTVEEEHFQYGIKSIYLIKEMVLNNSLITEEDLFNYIKIGINNFSNIQYDFFKKY